MHPLLDFEPAPFADLDPELLDEEVRRYRRTKAAIPGMSRRPPISPMAGMRRTGGLGIRPVLPRPLQPDTLRVWPMPGGILPLLPVVPAAMAPEGNQTVWGMGSTEGRRSSPAAGSSKFPASDSDGHQEEPSGFTRWVQSVLNQVMGTRLPLDGLLGPATRSALRAFQERQGLDPTGVMGPATEAALRRTQASRSSDAVAPSAASAPLEMESSSGLPVLRRGSRGAAVRALQERLNARGASLAQDGIFGPLTQSAVVRFQQVSGLKADGIVGPLTWSALLNGGASVPPPQPGDGAGATDSSGASSEFQSRIDKVLRDVPPEPGEVLSVGPTAQAFTRMTGLTQTALQANWAQGGKMTSCNSFAGWFSVAMGSKTYLGRFDVDRVAQRAWVPATNERLPKAGDILRFQSLHMGVCLGLRDGILFTVEGGQGGPRRGCDSIRRKTMRWDPTKFQGWVDLEGWIRSGG